MPEGRIELNDFFSPELLKQIDKFKKDMDELTQKMIKLISVTSNYSQEQTGLKNSTDGLNKENEKQTTQERAAASLREKIANVDKELIGLRIQLQQKVKSYTDQVKSEMAATGQLIGKNQSLRATIRANAQELAQMALQGKIGTAEFEKLLRVTGKMKDALADSTAAIRVAGDELRNIKGAISIMEGIAGAASVAEGAMQLFGAENEEVTQAIKKLVAIQGILNGVQAIGNVLQKESAAMLMLSNIRMKAMTLSTNLQAAAESKNIIVRNAAIVSQKALNAVMAMNPGALLLTVITAVAGAVLLFTRRNKEAEISQKDLNDAMSKGIDLQKEINQNFLRFDNQRVKTAERELVLAKARGDSQEKLYEKERALLILRTEVASEELSMMMEDLRNTQYWKDNKISSLKDLQNEYFVLNNTVRDLTDRLAKNPNDPIIKRQLEASQSQLELIKKSLDTIKDLQEKQNKSSLDLEVFDLERTKKLNEKKAKVNEKYQERKIDEHDKVSAIIIEKDDKLYETQLKQLENFVNSQISQEEQLAERKQRIFEESLANTEQYLQLTSELTDSFWNLQDTMFERMDTKEKQRTDNRLGRLKYEYDQGLITKDEYERRKEKIDKEAKVKEAKRARQQAILDKVLGIFKVNMDYNVGVMNALSSGDLMKAIPTILALKANQIISIASIMLQALPEIPQYWKGTEYSKKGLAWVGEHGAELMEKNGQRVLTPSVPTLTYLPEGTKITPANQVQSELSKLAGKKLIDKQEIQQEITVKPEKFIGISIDKGGFRTWVKQGDILTNYITSHFRV